MIRFLKWLARGFLCDHKGWYWKHIRNIYGDQINHYRGNRSEWECDHCHVTFYQPYLGPENK